MAGAGVEEGIALSAPFDGERSAMEWEAFDPPDDVVVMHARTRNGAVHWRP